MSEAWLSVSEAWLDGPEAWLVSSASRLGFSSHFISFPFIPFFFLGDLQSDTIYNPTLGGSTRSPFPDAPVVMLIRATEIDADNVGCNVSASFQFQTKKPNQETTRRKTIGEM